MATGKRLKEERRRCGLCVYCGRPAKLKADGTYGRRCEDCMASHLRQKNDSRCNKPLEKREVKKKVRPKTLTKKQITSILDRCRRKAG